MQPLSLRLLSKKLKAAAAQNGPEQPSTIIFNSADALQIGSNGQVHKATPDHYCVRDNEWVAGESGKTDMTIAGSTVDEWDTHSSGDMDCSSD